VDLLLYYPKAMLFKSSNDVDFVVYAMTIEPIEGKRSPLNVQIAQFADFQNYTDAKYKSRGELIKFIGQKLWIIKQKFRNAIFSIDIRQNDYFFLAM